MKQSPAQRLKENDDLAPIEQVTQFHAAMRLGRVRTIREIVRDNPKILRWVNDWGTVLHHAADESTVEVVEYLLSQGFSVDEPNPLSRWKDTPLLAAANNRDPAVVKLLVERGADVNAGARQCQTALHVAAFTGNDDIVLYLLEHGANPSFQDTDGETPLAVAIRMNRHRVIAVLREKGAPLKGIPVEKPPLRGTVTIDLPKFAGPIRKLIQGAVKRYAKEHAGEPVSALALHACAVTGFVSVCLDTGKFDGNVPGMKYAQYETVEVEKWRNAYEHAGKIIVTSDSSAPVKFTPGRSDDDKYQRPIYRFLLELLKQLAAAKTFDVLPKQAGFLIGLEIMDGSFGKFWRLRDTAS